MINLNEEQTKAVNCTEDKVVVLAGAGSGKTRVLTERVAKLLRDGVQPHSIVCITFTNFAANEMRQRLCNVSNISDAFIGTIHSFANKIYESSGCKYKIMNIDIEMDIMRYLIERYAKHVDYDMYLQIVEAENKIEKGILPDGYIAEVFPINVTKEIDILRLGFNDDIVITDLDTVKDYPETVKSYCIEHNIITFSELLVKAREYFETLGTNLEYLLVDEYQDITEQIDDFLKSLNPNNFFVVGDDNQAIYGFSGSDMTIMQNMVNDPSYTVYKLERNYRNSIKILEYAIGIVSQCDDVIPKHIEIMSNDTGMVNIFPLETFIDRVKDLDLERTTILTRTNRELNMIIGLLNSIGIPCHTFDKDTFSPKELEDFMNSDSLKIMTVHKSKGLEFDNVIMFSKYFKTVVPKYLKNDAERRVMYVGCTRARNTLTIFN